MNRIQSSSSYPTNQWNPYRVAFLTGTLALLAVALPTQLFAEDTQSKRTLIHVTFDEPAYTGPVIFTNPQPGELPVTDPTKRFSYVPEGASATIVERWDAEGGIPFGNEHCLVMNKEPGSQSFFIPFSVHPSDKVVGGKLTIEFNFLVDQLHAGNLFITARDDKNQGVSSLMLQPVGKLSLQSGEESVLIGTLEKMRGYHIKQVFDFNSGLVEIYLDGNPTGSPKLFVKEDGIAGFDISVLAPCEGKWAIDNINVELTEE